MQITEVQVRLVPSNDARLRAFCSMTLDDEFVVHDIKIIQGHGEVFVSMPSRRVTDHCPQCGTTNHLRARYCNQCGTSLLGHRAAANGGEKPRLHTDIAHPINAACRQRIQASLVEAFRKELVLSTQPGYAPRGLGDERGNDTPGQ